MIIYLDTKDHSKDNACNWQNNLANRLKFLKVRMCENTRYCIYHNVNGERWLEACTEQDFIEDEGKKVLIESCSDWKEEVLKYIN